MGLFPTLLSDLFVSDELNLRMCKNTDFSILLLTFFST